MIVRIFATSVLAKPLNNAQIVRGVFCLYTFVKDAQDCTFVQGRFNLQKGDDALSL